MITVGKRVRVKDLACCGLDNFESSIKVGEIGEVRVISLGDEIDVGIRAIEEKGGLSPELSQEIRIEQWMIEVDFGVKGCWFGCGLCLEPVE